MTNCAAVAYDGTVHMTNLTLTVAYDGSVYYGWQKTSMGPSIEEALEKVLEQILQHKVVLQAASRTDRGVHARGQVVNFFTDRRVELKKLFLQINALLPKDIRVLRVSKCHPSFHPTLNALEKTYEYRLSTSPFQSPFDRLYAWHFHKPLDLALMQEAALLLEGTHDFRGFTNQREGPSYKNSIRTIHKVSLSQEGENLKIAVTGKHFMYKMVRNLVGTLVFIGCKKLPIHVIHEVFSNKKRAHAGMTAPAHGLTLMHINYDDNFSFSYCES